MTLERELLERIYETLSDFLSDKSEIKCLLMVNGTAFVSYLANIFEELNILNKQLQATNKTLVDAKANIFGFITFTFIGFITFIMSEIYL